MLDGLVAVHTTGFVSGAPVLRQALEAFREHVFTLENVPAGDAGNWLWLATRTASALFDDELLIVLADRYVQLARDAGALAALPGALTTATCTRIYAGDLFRAAEFADEAAAMAKVSGAMPLTYARTLLDGWRGTDTPTTEAYATALTETTARSRGADATIAMLAMAVLHNGRGNYPAAQRAAVYARDAHEPAIR
jgi:hypothetical protein